MSAVKSPTQAGVVYAIRDPFTQAIRYIGKASYFASRRREHWSDLDRGRHPNRHLQAWYDKRCRPASVRPIIDVPQECLPGMIDAREVEGYAQA